MQCGDLRGLCVRGKVDRLRAEQKKLHAQQEELRKAIRHIGLTCGPLTSDFHHAAAQWGSEKSQFWGRAAFRCLWAVVEATLFGLRTMAAEIGQVTGVQFDTEEVEILSEKRISG